jgi:hypothetical protein
MWHSASHYATARPTISIEFSKGSVIDKASIVPSSPIFVTLMKEALSSPETLILTRVTRRNIRKDAILNSHRCEKLKSLIALTGWTL